jgi:hypothetical protein
MAKNRHDDDGTEGTTDAQMGELVSLCDHFIVGIMLKKFKSRLKMLEINGNISCTSGSSPKYSRNSGWVVCELWSKPRLGV